MNVLINCRQNSVLKAMNLQTYELVRRLNVISFVFVGALRRGLFGAAAPLQPVDHPFHHDVAGGDHRATKHRQHRLPAPDTGCRKVGRGKTAMVCRKNNFELIFHFSL